MARTTKKVSKNQILGSGDIVKKIKIFLTVGTRIEAFDRLVELGDQLARTGKYKIIAQIGPSKPPRYIKNWVRFTPLEEFRRYVKWADIILSHAGAGTLITARSFNKPIILVPRIKEYGEINDDNQIEFVRKWRDHPNIIGLEKLEITRIEKEIQKMYKNKRTDTKIFNQTNLTNRLIKWIMSNSSRKN